MSVPPSPINPWTLLFEDEELEAAYLEFTRKHLAKVVRIAMVIGTVLAVAYFVSQVVLAPSVWLTTNMMLLMVGVLGTLAVAMAIVEHLVGNDVVLTSMNSAFLLIVLNLSRDFPPDRRMLTSGFFISAILFNAVLTYSWRHKLLTVAIVNFFFFRFAVLDRIYDAAALGQLAAQFTCTSVLSTFTSYMLERMTRLQMLWRMRAAEERQKSDELLKKVLPDVVADRLKAGEAEIVDHHAAVTVIFADVVGFTKLSAARPPAETARILNDVFQRFDAVAARIGVEKVKTMGDGYLAIAGAPLPHADHAIQAVDMALEMREALVRYRAITGFAIEIRIGLSSGPVAAGVIGKTRFLYDYWGDTVNMASRMEQTGIPGQIQVSAATADLLRGHYELTPRLGIEIKGKGATDTYVVVRPLIQRPAA